MYWTKFSDELPPANTFIFVCAELEGPFDAELAQECLKHNILYPRPEMGIRLTPNDPSRFNLYRNFNHLGQYTEYFCDFDNEMIYWALLPEDLTTNFILKVK